MKVIALTIGAFFLFAEPGCPDEKLCTQSQRETSTDHKIHCSPSKESGNWKIYSWECPPGVPPGPNCIKHYWLPELELNPSVQRPLESGRTARNCIYYAFEELYHLGLIYYTDYQKVTNNRICYSNFCLTGSEYCECHAVGCYTHEVEVKITNGSKSISCEDFILITNCLFTRGSLDLDPSGKILWNKSYKNSSQEDRLYYRYATNIIEAIEYVILHEYAHYKGSDSEGMADYYARNMIIEIRKHKQGKKALLNPIPFENKECKENENEHHCLIPEGLSPSKYDLPPGLE
jgi:hypothetical protein